MKSFCTFSLFLALHFLLGCRISNQINSEVKSIPSGDEGLVPSLSISDLNITEGSDGGLKTATLSVVASSVSKSDIVVNYALNEGTAQSVVPIDFTAASGTITIPAGQLSASFDIQVLKDNTDEPDETLTVTLSGGSGYNTLNSDLTATLTILDDDLPPTISINDVAVSEESQMDFTISLSAISEKNISFQLETANVTATDGLDYTLKSEVISIPPNTSQVSYTVPILDDITTCENSESFEVNLSSLVNLTVSGSDLQGIGTILDNEKPTLTVSPVTVTEGMNATFNVSLSCAYPVAISFDWSTIDSTAKASEDYNYTSGTMNIPASSTTTTLTVPTINDSQNELEEQFFISLSNPSNALLSEASIGIGTIQDNDGTTGVAKIVAGKDFSCALSNSGNVKCWGLNNLGQLGQNGNNNGDEAGEMGDALPTVNLGAGRTALKIVSGANSTCIILDNNTLKCFGNNIGGKLGLGHMHPKGGNPGDMGDNLPTIDLGTGRTVIDVAIGRRHTCAILNGGDVKCWGYGYSGQLGNESSLARGDEPGEMGDNLPLTNLGTGKTATAIVSGHEFNCSLLNDGQVKCWGHPSTHGYLGYEDELTRGKTPGDMGDNLPNVNLGAGRTALKIAASSRNVCVILDNNDLKCWGDGYGGKLGTGNTASLGDDPGEMGDNLLPIDLGTGKTATSVSLSETHICALLNDSTVKCWGYGISGALGNGNTTNIGDNPGEMGDNLATVDLGTALTPQSVHAGHNRTCVKFTDNSIKCWGDNTFGQLGLEDQATRGDAPGEMGDNLPFVNLGTGKTVTQLNLPNVSHLESYYFSNSNLKGHYACAILNDNSVKCWGQDLFGETGLENVSIGGGPSQMGANLPIVNLGTGRKAKDIAIGMDSVCVIRDDNSLVCWGDNSNAQLGLGISKSIKIGDHPNEMGDNLNPVNLGTGKYPLQLGAVEYSGSFCTLLNDFSIKCWGGNYRGVLGIEIPNTQIGDVPSEMGDNLAPVLLGANRKAFKVVGGYQHFCALLDNNEIKCWGNNTSGQLGLENTTAHGEAVGSMGDNLPAVDLGTVSLPIDVFTSQFFSCALFNNGKSKCWGDGNGVLGTGNTAAVGDGSGEMGDNLAFIDIGTGLSIKSLFTNFVSQSVCAILNDNTLKCWGTNSYGQLGIESTIHIGDNFGEMGDNLGITLLGTGRTAQSVSTGMNHTCAILDNGSVKCWGANNLSQLGIENTTHKGDNPSEMNDNLPVVNLNF